MRLVFLWLAGFPGGGGFGKGKSHQIKINYPHRILKLSGQVCLSKNTC